LHVDVLERSLRKHANEVGPLGLLLLNKFLMLEAIAIETGIANVKLNKAELEALFELLFLHVFCDLLVSIPHFLVIVRDHKVLEEVAQVPIALEGTEKVQVLEAALFLVVHCTSLAEET
jgi:hypothetical protein